MKGCLEIAVTGDVDSGKSTLIGRFLYEMGLVSREATEEIRRICQRQGSDFEFAYVLDSLEEERKNQLTMDTTQAFCKTRTGKEFAFIDVPGHRELLRHMLCGSSYADMAILVIDAQKSIQEQTRRHAFILKFLGIEEVVIVINKMDRLDFNEAVFRKIQRETAGLFAQIQLRSRYCIPISAKQGDNLVARSKETRWYGRMTILEALTACGKRKKKGDFCFPVQDIYTLYNNKIAVGKIVSGKIRKREEVRCLPLNKVCTVERIVIFDKDVSGAEAPGSVGLVLDTMEGLRRGHVICRTKASQASQEIAARIFCVRPLDIRQRLILRCATQEASARIQEIRGIRDSVRLEPKAKTGPLEEADIAEAIIVTDTPVVTERFGGSNELGRFILEENGDICAVGIIP